MYRLSEITVTEIWTSGALVEISVQEITAGEEPVAFSLHAPVLWSEDRGEYHEGDHTLAWRITLISGDLEDARKPGS
jgi:hypothetical protein